MNNLHSALTCLAFHRFALALAACLLSAAVADVARAQTPAAPPASGESAPVQQAQPAPGGPAPAVPTQPAQPQPAQAQPAPPPAQGAAQPRPPTEIPAVVFQPGAADTLLGKSVQSATGEDMGRIVDVIVDRTGMLRAALIDFGGFLGVGSRKIAVDWRVLHFPPDDDLSFLIAELPRDQVRVAPAYNPGEPIVVIGRSDAPAPTTAPARPAPPPVNGAAPSQPAPAPADAPSAAPVPASPAQP